MSFKTDSYEDGWDDGYDQGYTDGMSQHDERTIHREGFAEADSLYRGALIEAGLREVDINHALQSSDPQALARLIRKTINER